MVARDTSAIAIRDIVDLVVTLSPRLMRIHHEHVPAEPLPLDDPPGSRLMSCGFCVVPLTEDVENHDAAQSGIDDLPKMTAPACFNFVTSVASFIGM